MTNSTTAKTANHASHLRFPVKGWFHLLGGFSPIIVYAFRNSTRRWLRGAPGLGWLASGFPIGSTSLINNCSCCFSNLRICGDGGVIGRKLNFGVSRVA